MINVEAPGYESEWPEENQDDPWNAMIQDAVKGFVSSVEASSRQMADAGYHRRGAAQLQKDRARLDQIQIDLAQCFARWSELEARDAMNGSP